MMREGTAMFQLTREYLAQVAPDLDPDQASFEVLVDLLGDEKFLPWLDAHPDKALVERYWEEEQSACAKMVAKAAVHLAKKPEVKSVTLFHDGDRQSIIRPID